MTVPSIYQGLWRRTGIRRSNGNTDTTTQVWWFQAARFHIDLRIPIDRPDPASRTHIVKYLPQQLARFGAQTGFAGTTVVEGNHCEWHPEIAFPWVSDVPDAGWMRFDSDDALHETADDGSYEEDWERVASGPMVGVRLEDPHAGTFAYLIANDLWMAWACGRPDDHYDQGAPLSSPWSEFTVLKKGIHWRVMASNMPWLEGAEVPQADGLDCEHIAQWAVGSAKLLPFAHELTWRVLDITVD
ncbi:hypothetical protein GCM10027277_38880 [Pseudoduganella ginsengisoli]|uniref:Uncharacterized protein n=1 Tax=Pseudoduganella ginsengisoli TaxID=1462440 RepID=A0A6L6PY40_9BURK|nr:hypothetical protein [Pseudoduganella ginsengisoli]MTW02041.1 hypothetical protein [Pseudoduganella ginsengisoli]